MSRLYDKIMRYGSMASIDDQEAYDLVASGLNDATVVDVTNVARYWAEQREAEFVKSTDLPNVAPSLTTAFFEYRWPATGYKDPDEAIEAVGILVGAGEVSEEEQGTYGISEHKWRLHWFPFLKLKGRMPIEGPLSWSVMPVTESGSLARVKGSGSGIPWIYPSQTDFEKAESLRRFTFAPVLLAMAFMHCKNVAHVHNEPPAKASVKHNKRHGIPLTTYKTLSIGPMTDTLEREGEISKNGLKRALHICRGHFATYSPDKPLFGKYAGTFWKPQHVKGNMASGEVVKDYAVKAPQS